MTENPPFTLEFPAGWHVEENGNAFGLEAPHDDVAVTLTRVSSPDGDIPPQSMQLILDTFSEGRPRRSEPQWLSSEEWNSVEAEFGPAAADQEDSHWLFRAVCSGNRAYIITATGPRADLERNRQACTRIMHSLQLRIT